MTSVNAPILGFQGGILGKHLSGRVDVPSYARSAEIMDNWRPYAQGPMTRRPPLQYVNTVENSDRPSELFPFVFNTDQSYMVVANNGVFRFYINDGVIRTDAVTAAIQNGTFDGTNTDLADGAGITASSTASGAVANLIDEDVTTHWQAGAAATATLDFDLTAAKTLRDIWLTSDNTLNANAPNEFTVHGSATGAFAGEETLILNVTGEANWSASEKRKYRITTPGSYQYYRLTMTDSEAGTGNYALSEVSLYDSVWFDNSTGNGVVSITAGKMYLDSDGGATVVAEQILDINEANTEHILVFAIEHGPINLRIGSTSGDDDILVHEGLRRGEHRLAFDPAAHAQVYIQFYHSANAGRIIDNVSIKAGEQFGISHPYSDDELPEIEYQQIGDVLYLAHRNHETRRLERRSHRSWSLTLNHVDNGPFTIQNLTPTTISASGTSGEVTLTATDEVFDVSNDRGQLFALTDSGQLKTTTGTVVGDSTDGIKVTGSSGAARTFNIQISGTFTGTVRLQESSGNENNYVNTGTTYTAPANQNYDDNKDNQTWFYRLIVEGLSSGTVTMKLTYTGGSSTGIVRIISVTSATFATAEVIDPIPSTDAIRTWQRSIWNEGAGWPNAVTNAYGRTWYARGITIWASVSDDFTNFDEGKEADDAFSVTLAQESSEGILWLNYIGRLVIGTRTREWIGLGNTSSEPVGPTNFQTVPGSEEGVAPVSSVRSEGSVVFVHRSRKKLMQFTQSSQALSQENFTAIDLTELAPELLDDEVVSIAIQREPQRRIFAVLRSGRVGELLYRREIEVTAWDTMKTDGRVESVNVIQQDNEDHVYFIVRRKVGGVWKRFIERYGSEYVYTDPERYHLDSALTRDLERPDTMIEPSGTTGTITVTADDAAFASGDVGKRIWLGKGRGLIASYVSDTEITIDLTTDLDEFTGTDPIPSGRWGFSDEITTVTGLAHLEGRAVRVYADMIDQGDYTVLGGAITFDNPASIIHAGLPFTSTYRSLKLAYGAQKGTAIGMKKSIKQLIAILYRTGPTLKHGRKLAKVFGIKTRDDRVQWGEPVPLFDGEKNGLAYDTSAETDPRFHLVVDGPEPATVVGLVPSITTIDV